MKHYYHYISEENELLNDLLSYINIYTSLFSSYYKNYENYYYLIIIVSDKNIPYIRQWKTHPNWFKLENLTEIESLNDFLSILNEAIEYLDIKEEIKNTIKSKITKIIENENENQLQREENSQSGRNLEQGCRVCSRRNQIKIAVGHLSNETRFTNFRKQITRAENNLSFSSRQVF